MYKPTDEEMAGLGFAQVASKKTMLDAAFGPTTTWERRSDNAVAKVYWDSFCGVHLGGEKPKEGRSIIPFTLRPVSSFEDVKGRVEHLNELLK